MKYNGEYEVDPAFTTKDAIKWKMTGNGEFVIATKGKRKFFVKRNIHARYPLKDLPKPVYDQRKAEADELQHKQERLRKLMKGLDWATDHIVVEEDNFWDAENRFTTVTAFIPDLLPDDYRYEALPLEAFLHLALQTAKALETLHARGVIHGDLKEKNIAVTKTGGVHTPHLIDFDSSYPADEIPAWDRIGGSAGYQSPEVIFYGHDEGAAPKETITPATDIFSLGVVFHKWWVDSFPGIDMESGSVGAAVYLDKAVTIHKKFNVRIGPNCGATLQSLINWMFAKDPAARPTATQVVAVLSDQLEIPEAFQKGDDEKPFDTELWSAHQMFAELLPVSELKSKGVKSLRRINEKGGSASLKYRVVMEDGTDTVLTIAELCEVGFAIDKGADVEEAWEEHMIEFEPATVISKKGYAKIRRTTIGFRKRYLIITVTGMQIDKGAEWLVTEGLAHPKTVEVEADTPWPEHGTAYNHQNMARLGVKSISRMEVAGEHRYRIVYNQIVDGKNKVNERVPVNNLKLMGFIV